MNRSQCEHLDDYLLGWLSPDEAAAFERHLAGCPACGREREVQRSIENLLGSGEAFSEPLPLGLIDRIRDGLQADQPRPSGRRAWVLAVAASVLVLALAGGLTLGRWSPRGQQQAAVPSQPQQGVASAPDNLSPREPLPEESTPNRAALAVPAAARPHPGPARVALADPSAGIVVPVATKNPNITMVWIYPTIKPAAPSGASGSE